MNDIDRNYIALAGWILSNENLVIETALNRMGIKTKVLRLEGFGNVKTQNILLENSQNIINMYLIENQSIAKIAKKYGVCKKTISKYLIKSRVEIRTKGAIKGKKKGV